MNAHTEPTHAIPISGLYAEGLGKSYRGRAVVKDISLQLNRGEVVGLLGPNGAGKTTCFYMIMGLVGADYGAIYMDGEEVTALPMYQRARLGLGYLPQEPSVFRGLSVEDNIKAIAEMHCGGRKAAAIRTEGLMVELGVDHLAKSSALALSGGERRRVEIARALAGDPAYILLDEPFAGIDPIAIDDIREVIRLLKARGIGVLITDHNVRETLDIVDRAAIIADGRVLFEGTPEAVLGDAEVRRTYLGERFSA
jgi:lipopolysaccharide export system ATP-binding protein